MSHDPDIEAWIDRARSTDILEVATEMGAVLRRSAGEYVGPCPRCNGTDRFAVKPSEAVYNCRGAGGGDVIALVMHVRDVPFMEAVEIINGEPPPRRDTQVRPVDHEIQRERREERRDVEIGRQEAEREKQGRNADRAARIFNQSSPIAGTLAEAYLRRRGIVASSDLLADLRFAAGLDYRGYADPDATEETALGSFPCMVAAIRNVAGEIIGLHRTYLDPSEPAKLKPPGDPRQNKAKKSFGTVKGGAIRLGPIKPIMAIGEGIETCLSWFLLDTGGPHDLGLMCAVSLGNLAGETTGSMRHPSGRGTIPNCTPDPDKPGIILPDEVREVIILGDGDSDWFATHARILTAARRFQEQGRIVSVHYAPPKADFNDVLRDRRRAA